MTLLVIEGFDTRSPKTQWRVGPATYSAGRFGGFGITPGSADVELAFVSSLSNPIAGFAVLPSMTQDRVICGWRSLSGNQIDIRQLTTGHIELRRGGTVIALSAGAVLTDSVWTYMEVKPTLADAGGTVVIKVNGNTVIDFTGDTRNSGTETAFSSIYFPTNSGIKIDDFYLMDNTGSAPYNDFYGEMKIETLVPNGNGAFSQLLGSDGNSTDNYLLVDEIPASMTDYVGSSTIGQRDTYTFQNSSTGSGQVAAVQTCVYAQKTDAGAASVKTVERASAGPTERVSAAITVSNPTWVQNGPQITDPTGATWSIATVNSAEFGVEVA